MSINRVILTGRMTRDAELRTTSTGKNVAEFGLAVNKKIRPQDGSPDAFFFNIKVWGQSAEYASNYLGKGRLVAVDGRLEQRHYVANDGTKREVIEVVADSIYGLDRPRDDDESGPPESVGSRHYPPASPSGPVAGIATDEYDPFADE